MHNNFNRLNNYLILAGILLILGALSVSIIKEK